MDDANDHSLGSVSSRDDRVQASVSPESVKSSAPLLGPILAGPIVPTMLRLALPTLVVLLVQTSVGVAETYFVSFLGTEALTGVALVFPVLMLMQMMSNGGIGGGVAAAIARALGGGRTADAEALVFHALVLAGLFGLAFTAAALLGGPVLYRALGGTEGALRAALTYSDIVFAGAIPLWVVAVLASALRGSGNVRVPALVTVIGAALLVLASPALIFGWGPLPRLGIAGAGIAVVTYYLGGAAALIGYLATGRGLRLRRVKLEGRLFKDILGVGILSAIGTVQANLTVALVTGAVGLFGAEAIAGYGLASRLDYVLVPLLFGFGTALVTMVAANLGSGQVKRARRIAWIGAAIGAGATELIGLAAASYPAGWIGLFSDDPTVFQTGALYLRTVAPCYGFFGLGMMLYFASQGARRVAWPVIGGTIRLIVAGLAGWSAVAWLDAGLTTLFAVVALSMVLFGSICALAVRMSRWQPSAPDIRSGRIAAGRRIV
ncbi:MAG: MATE family efflux transporter [Proteobacteria bacterium]|nr:MATE family efflux transporter [Pseudomonadota bacterium]MBI3499308.1 MATE family efflux transporter [Pseudomonadota bacterium]